MGISIPKYENPIVLSQIPKQNGVSSVLVLKNFVFFIILRNFLEKKNISESIERIEKNFFVDDNEMDLKCGK